MYDYLNRKLIGDRASRRHTNLNDNFQLDVVSNHDLQFHQSAKQIDQTLLKLNNRDEPNGQSEVVNKLLLLALEEKIKVFMRNELERCMDTESIPEPL